jgi:2-hydroxychromene-2-carboxylate isomerase
MTTLYYDLGSPYAYLAVARSEQVLGQDVTLQPVLAGAIFRQRGWGSWGQTGARSRNVAEIERRAAAYGLPPVQWPSGWPNNTLSAMRLATWADARGAGAAFARAGFAAAFQQGRDLSDRETLLAAAASSGLEPDAAARAIADDAVKTALREATERAIAAGVRGVPTTAVDGQLFFGDDQLAAAARRHGRSSGR